MRNHSKNCFIIELNQLFINLFQISLFKNFKDLMDQINSSSNKKRDLHAFQAQEFLGKLRSKLDFYKVLDEHCKSQIFLSQTFISLVLHASNWADK